MRRAPRLLDISQPLDARTAAWPGDTPFAARWVAAIARGAAVNVSVVTTSPHNGTHADAPCHFVDGAAGIGEVPLESYIGPCRVVQRMGDRPLAAAEVRRWRVRRGERLLVRTRRRVDPRRFPARFAHLTGESARALAGAGAVLFGIDTPSVDHRESKSMEAHRALLSGGVAILENLDLTRARPGRWELLAAPVKFTGLDAGFVRAVLRTRR